MQDLRRELDARVGGALALAWRWAGGGRSGSTRRAPLRQYAAGSRPVRSDRSLTRYAACSRPVRSDRSLTQDAAGSRPVRSDRPLTTASEFTLDNLPAPIAVW